MATTANTAINSSHNAGETKTKMRSKHTLYILSDFHPDAITHAQSLFTTCILPTDLEAANWRSNATAILIKDVAITAAELAAAPKLRVIGKQGTGLDQIDLSACAAAGVAVRNAPGINAGAVAEMTLALLLSVARAIPQLHTRMVARGEVVRKEDCWDDGVLVSGRTVGVVGMGAVGRAFAGMCQGGLGCRVLAYDPFFPGSTEGTAWEGLEHRRCGALEELLVEADVVSLHVPLTGATRGMLGYAQLCMMQKSAILLNASRGGIVDEADLLRALDEGRIWGAGFDCHVEEPPTRDTYGKGLWAHPRYVGTPHVAAATRETQVATVNKATEGVWEFLMNLNDGDAAGRREVTDA